MALTMFRLAFLCVLLVTLVTSSPLRRIRDTEALTPDSQAPTNSIEPSLGGSKQDLLTAETLWGPGPSGPGPWGPPPPWAFGPGPFGPFGPGPFGGFGGGPFGPGFGPFG